MTDKALRYQELIERGYPDHTARHIVAQELNDDQVDMMVVCGMLPEPRPLRSADVRAKADALHRLRNVVRGSLAMTNAGIVQDARSLLADYDQQGKMIEQLAAQVHRLADNVQYLREKNREAWGGLTEASRQNAELRRAAESEPPLHEWRCPSCGETTRARMADQEPEYCTCEPKPSGEAPDEPDRDCPVHGQGPPPKRDPSKDVPLINGEPAF